MRYYNTFFLELMCVSFSWGWRWYSMKNKNNLNNILLSLAWKLVWCWENTLDTELENQPEYFLAWKFSINLAHGKDLWLEFHLVHWVDWLLAQNKVGLFLGLPNGYPVKSPNPIDVLPEMLMGAPIGLWFGSEAVMCWCSIRWLIEWCDFFAWG